MKQSTPPTVGLCSAPTARFRPSSPTVEYPKDSGVSLGASVIDAMKKLQDYVDDLNKNIEKLDVRGPVSKYVLPEENLRGSVENAEVAKLSHVCFLHIRGKLKTSDFSPGVVYDINYMVKLGGNCQSNGTIQVTRSKSSANSGGVGQGSSQP